MILNNGKIVDTSGAGALSDVLVMLAPYGTERASTSEFVSMLQLQDAQVIRTQAKAEVSLTRCVLAAGAYDVLRQNPHLNWVFWLDQDISGMWHSVHDLIKVAQAVRNLGAGVGYPTVSGVYVNRHTQPPRVAAYAVRRMDPIKLMLPRATGEPYIETECVPALCGMGCLLQHRSTFMQHCDESPHFAFPNADSIVPEVCTSHRIHASEMAKYIEMPEGQDLHYWWSEDFDYCAREFEHGRLVFTAAVMFGHESNVVQWPSDCVFPGLRAPEPEHANETKPG